LQIQEVTANIETENRKCEGDRLKEQDKLNL